jgi:hypothetical protein
MKYKSFFTAAFLLIVASSAYAQKQATIFEVPGVNQYCKIDLQGTSVLPSGRFVTPAGQMTRITHDPFGLSISPDGKKAITLHNGCIKGSLVR